MVSFRDLQAALRRLEIDPVRPVIAHASLSAFGKVLGGAETVLGALLAVFPTLVMPAFTYKTMLTPEEGPPHNAIEYGTEYDRNRMAEFYRPSMPVDRLIGAVSEALRNHPKAQRSTHPILSFCGIQAESFLSAQTCEEPLAPIRLLTERGGWVLLLGVDHTVNTSIHFGERRAGRAGFVRWALTPKGVRECPGFPGCSDGFGQLAHRLEAITRSTQAGAAQIQALPLRDLIEITRRTVSDDPQALLCNRSYCERCQEVRNRVLHQPLKLANYPARHIHDSEA